MKVFVSLTGALVLAATPLFAAGEQPVDFVTQIKPILADRCVECHNSETILGELNLQSRESTMRKRNSGPVIVPKEPDKSSFLHVLVLPEGERKAMPATGHRIAKAEVDIIRRWIAEGAPWPDGKDGLIPSKKMPGKK